MLRPQRPHQRVLHEVVGKLAIAGERASIPSQCWNRRLDLLPESAQRTLPPSSPQCIAYWDDPPTVSIPCSSLLAGEPYHPEKHFARSDIPAAGWRQSGGKWRLLVGSFALCHRETRGRRRSEEDHAGSLGSLARQARLDPGCRQQPLARLGYRKGLPWAGRRARFHLSGRGVEEAGRTPGA